MFEQNCSVVEPQPVPERITSHSIFKAYGMMGGGGGGGGGWRLAVLLWNDVDSGKGFFRQWPQISLV